MYEIADVCKECQKRHMKIKGKWDVNCFGIPKVLWEKNYFPIENAFDEEDYEHLTDEEKINLQYKFNKLLWAEDNLGWSVVNKKRVLDDGSYYEQIYQKELLLCTAKRKVGRLGRRMGKCNSEDGIILTKNRGTIKIKELKKGDTLFSYDEKTKKFVEQKEWYKSDNGIKETFELKTRLGSIDEVTAEHPYYTFNGKSFVWTPLNKLKKGDRILTIESYNELFGNEHKEKDLFELFGYLISDGGTNYGNQVRFTNFDPITVLYMKKLLKKFGTKLKRYSKGNYNIKTINGGKNEVIKLVKENNLVSLAINKKIPEKIFSGNNKDVASFISTAWDCDGWVTEKEIGYCSSSYDLANGIKILLKRFGIIAKVEKKKVKYKDDYKFTFQVRFRDLKNIKKFHSNIQLKAKQYKVDKLVKNRKGVDYTWFNTMPKETNTLVKDKIRSKDLSENKIGIRVRNEYALTRNKINRINKNIEDGFLNFLANGNYVLDEVSEINCKGEKQTYSIGVPGLHNFITNDMLTHNTEILAVDALHYSFHNPGTTVMILTPFQNTIDEIFARLKEKLDGDDSKYKGSYKSKAKPNQITLNVDGKETIIKGFTTGTKSGNEGASTRGQKADRIYFDETAYFSDKDIETVYALVLESKEVEVIAFSTPSALKTLYRNWCNDEPNWKDFHFPSTLLPSWEEQKDELLRLYTEQGFAQEILAEFYEDSGKVFHTEHLEASYTDYNYYNKIEDLENPSEWITVIGVDWNEWKNGVQIVVLGYNRKTKRFRILHRKSVHKGVSGDKNVQTAALMDIIDLDSRFKVRFLYVDKGFGSTQSELLQKYYYQKEEIHKLKIIDFASSFVRKNFLTGEDEKKRMKGMMVYFLQKRFEHKEIEISKKEEEGLTGLVSQMDNFIVDHYDSKDNPVFAAGKKSGDHILDAFMLANFAFVEQFEEILKFENMIKITPSKPNKEEMQEYIDSVSSPVEKVKKREEILTSNDEYKKNRKKLFGKKVRRTTRSSI